MAWATIRRATSEDEARLHRAAVRFAKRHNLQYGETAEQSIDFAISERYGASADERAESRRLERLWLACTRRALREPQSEGIAWGYVGRREA